MSTILFRVDVPPSPVTHFAYPCAPIVSGLFSVTQGQNGKLYTWGKNNVGQLGLGNTTNNTIVGKIADGITEISAGGNLLLYILPCL